MKISTRVRLIAAICAIVVIAGIGAVWFYMSRDINPIPKEIRQQARTTLYYPKDVPKDKFSGFSVQEDGKLVSYIVNVDGTDVYVAIQPKTTRFDNDQFQKGIKNATQVQTSYGAVYIGDLGGRTIGNLITADNWILLSGSSDSAHEAIRLASMALSNTKD